LHIIYKRDFLKLNTTSQYAIKIVAYIAQHDQTPKPNAKMISQDLDIPYKYLTRIMAQLVDAKIIYSIRGREGGYGVLKALNEITLKDILDAVHESLHQQKCLLGNKACNERQKCILHDKWTKPKEGIARMFESTTLNDIL